MLWRWRRLGEVNPDRWFWPPLLADHDFSYLYEWNMTMVIFLLILALIAVGIGLFTLTQATMGVGILALACIFAIFARIAQAAKHQAQLQAMLAERSPAPPYSGSTSR